MFLICSGIDRVDVFFSLLSLAFILLFFVGDQFKNRELETGNDLKDPGLSSEELGGNRPEPEPGYNNIEPVGSWVKSSEELAESEPEPGYGGFRAPGGSSKKRAGLNTSKKEESVEHGLDYQDSEAVEYGSDYDDYMSWKRH